MKRPRGKSASVAAATTEAAYTFIPTTTDSSSPIDGVENELALLLIRAIKARRKLFSSSSKRSANTSTRNNDDDDDAENAASDAITTFLNALKHHVQTPRRGAANTAQYRNDAPSNCLHFLLEIISDPTNSIHLRRSALYTTTQILVKSSNARQYFAKDPSSQLLNFIGVVERMGGEAGAATATGENHGRTDEEITTTNDNNIIQSSGNFDQQHYYSSPQAKLQLEAVELIHTLANDFGTYYPQFTVASRLLGDISLHFSPPPSTTTTASSSTTAQNYRSSSATLRMRVLRTDREEALALGPSACHQFERMVDRADTYFRILMPRYGGFNSDILPVGVVSSPKVEERKLELRDDIMTSDEEKIGLVDNCTNQIEKGDGVGVSKVVEVVEEDDDDDISVDWEDGDVKSCDEVNNDDTNRGEKVSNVHTVDNHQAAVSHTLDVITRSGALLDGQLAILLGRGASTSTRTESSTQPVGEPCVDTLATTTTEQTTDPNTVSHRRLHNLVRKISLRHLPRLNQWIHALSHADMMEERTVVDPVSAAMPGMGGGSRSSSGPVSLVLLSQEKRAMRGTMLQRMMRIREDLVGVLRSSDSLGITADMNRRALNAVPAGEDGNEALPHDASSTVAREHPIPLIMPSRTETMAAPSISKRKHFKSSRFRVIYNRNR
jgi:hypothetical protein